MVVPLIMIFVTLAAVRLYIVKLCLLVKVNFAEIDVRVVMFSFFPLKFTLSHLKLTSMIVELATAGTSVELTSLNDEAENSVAVLSRIISSCCFSWLPFVNLWKTLTVTAGATMRYTLSSYPNTDGPLEILALARARKWALTQLTQTRRRTNKKSTEVKLVLEG